jgi:NADPH:quinone reductase-like Zn-dependent oxidoreductase
MPATFAVPTLVDVVRYGTIAAHTNGASMRAAVFDQHGGPGVRPVINSVYPLKEFSAGLARLLSNAVFGKVLVRIG